MRSLWKIQSGMGETGGRDPKRRGSDAEQHSRHRSRHVQLQ